MPDQLEEIDDLQIDKDRLNKFRDEVFVTYNRNQEDFEKQLIFISSGSLGLSMFFIEKIVKDINQAENKFLLAFGWIMLSVTLLINLASHFLGIRFNYKTIKEIDNDEYDERKPLKRNNDLNKLNFISLLTIIVGILSIIIFSTLNIFSNNSKSDNMVNQSSRTLNETIKVLHSDTDKGVLTGPPPTIRPTTKK